MFPSIAKLPRYIPIVCPLLSKNSKKVFLTSGAVHFSCAILAIVVEKILDVREVGMLVVARVRPRKVFIRVVVL